jgi:hypothetical protein
MSQADGSPYSFPTPSQTVNIDLASIRYFFNNNEAATLLGGDDLDPTTSFLQRSAQLINSVAMLNKLTASLSTLVGADDTRLDA